MNQFAFQDQKIVSLPDARRSLNPRRLFGGISRAIESVAGDAFVQAMRGAATGVNIVTTDGPAGRFGVTVSAFTSVSAEPPTVLVCINRRSPACAAVRENRAFCINVLSTQQKPLADTFSGRPASGNPYDFDSESWLRSETGSPLLEDGVANFDCTLESAIDAGTHTIFIGNVRAVAQNDSAPLLYTNRSYRRACCAV